MKPAIFAVLAFVGILVSGYFMPIIPISTANAAPGAKEENISQGPSFVKLPSILLPIMYNQKVVQIVEINLIAEVRDDAMAEKFKSKKTQIQSAIFFELHGSLDESVGQRGEMVDVQKLKRQAARALGTVVGKENINDLLLDSIRQRKS